MAKKLSDDVKKALTQEAVRRLDHGAFFARLEELGIKASDEEPGAMLPLDGDALSLARDRYQQNKEYSFLEECPKDWASQNQSIRDYWEKRTDKAELEALLNQILTQFSD
ncbi:MAG TPA: hypothetical protein PLN21_16670 [Gemmatales bacterium]|nr:hypothetical protein [Gemmatales bacterium]